MLSNLYSIASRALTNAQVSIDNASNNIANADTEGYQKTVTVYESTSSITISGLSVGTGADITSIQSTLDAFIEAQYLDASADLAKESSAYEYLSQLDELLNQSDEDNTLSAILSDFFDAWNGLVTDPDSESAREELLGLSETLAYALNTAAGQLGEVADTINDEIRDQVKSANQIIGDIADLNASIVANPDDQDSISQRDQLIRELNAIIGVDVQYKENGEVFIQTEEGYTLVDGTQTHDLVYGQAKATQSLLRASDYDGSIAYSGASSEEILIDFVTGGADGAAQFRVSLDGGETWVEDEDGDTMLYTAGDEDAAVEVAGVSIWFEDGAQDHMAGDRYTIVAKTGLYWESSDGSLQNITPMTDASGSSVDGRTSSGSLAGLFSSRDDTVIPTLDDLDEFTEALVWEVNSVHSTGAGLEHHSALTGSYSVDDTAAALSNAGLAYGDRITSDQLEIQTYDSDGALASSVLVSVDPSDSLQDVADHVNAAFLATGEVTASINGDNQLVIAATGDYEFEITGDASNLLAALGLNTYFSGSGASDIAVDGAIASDVSHINAGVVGDDGLVATGSNDAASAIFELAEEPVAVGGSETSLSSALASLVASAGSAASSAEVRQVYAATASDYFYNQQASASEVNVDEELIDLTKHQQAYQAAAEIISVTQTLFDTILDMV
ncbi:flagellar hook-associated protein FlgK [Pseudodesulfovibrio sp.]|uniref:flagellar hook-associated protein FlgK n=1 Tax=Pseudodesulfovibrio sp. TaxID=2035812 RepID=UPI00260F5D1F|nr:flagellar hook-associated protein FlgK [Pseudodesulfovibrio sp.]MDD3311597.1 flagellar hook-associated protein FlgK [Pseudodesulfovibrio sp.]